MNKQRFDNIFFSRNYNRNSMSEQSSYTNYRSIDSNLNTNNLIKTTPKRFNTMELSIPTQKIRRYIVEFIKDFKAGFLPMFLYLTAILLVIWLLNLFFSKETALGILFLGVGVYITAMLGGLKRLRGQDTIFSTSWKEESNKQKVSER